MENNRLDMIKDLLQANKMRVTQSRMAVAKTLLSNETKHLSSDEIYSKIQDSKDLKCDPVSVYRVLTAFEDIGLVKKSVFQGDAARYTLTEFGKTNKHNHEHYFKCISCNQIEPFSDCLVFQKEKELLANGYQALKHHLEITGICPACAAS